MSANTKRINGKEHRVLKTWYVGNCSIGDICVECSLLQNDLVVVQKYKDFEPISSKKKIVPFEVYIELFGEDGKIRKNENVALLNRCIKWLDIDEKKSLEKLSLNANL